MNLNNFRYFTDLSVRYADDICRQTHTETFDRCALAAAYTLGAHSAMKLFLDAVDHSARLGAITPVQQSRINSIAEALASKPAFSSGNEQQYR